MRLKVWRARLESPLFNCSMYANDLEKVYMTMWHMYRNGQKPDISSNKKMLNFL